MQYRVEIGPYSVWAANAVAVRELISEMGRSGESSPDRKPGGNEPGQVDNDAFGAKTTSDQSREGQDPGSRMSYPDESRLRERTVRALRYLMANFPEPVTSADLRDHLGLESGRALSAVKGATDRIAKQFGFQDINEVMPTTQSENGVLWATGPRTKDLIESITGQTSMNDL